MSKGYLYVHLRTVSLCHVFSSLPDINDSHLACYLVDNIGEFNVNLWLLLFSSAQNEVTRQSNNKKNSRGPQISIKLL